MPANLKQPKAKSIIKQRRTLLDLADYETKTRSAVMRFWSVWKKSGTKKSMVGGMDGFADLVAGIVHANGLTRANVLQQGGAVSLPGHFSPTQSWDIVVVNQGRLIAAIKLDPVPGEVLAKHAGSACKEVLGMAMELRAAYRRHLFGEVMHPFVGYLVLLEDAPSSRCAVPDVSPHFPMCPEFRNASYADRYNNLCEKLMKEGLYANASLILTPRTAVKSGAYSEMSKLTGLTSFVAGLAGRVAMEAMS